MQTTHTKKIFGLLSSVNLIKEIKIKTILEKITVLLVI